MHSYIALIHKEKKSDFGVSFPDFPGCVTAGTTLQEAAAMAVEALDLHIEGMVEDGLTVPEPSPIEAVMADPDNRDGVAVLVTPRTGTPRTVRVNITLPEDTLQEIDAYAAENGYTRSGLIARASQIMIRGDHAAAAATDTPRASGLSEPAKAYRAAGGRASQTIRRTGGIPAIGKSWKKK